MTVPLHVTDMADGVVWLPTNSPGSAVRADLGAGPREQGDPEEGRMSQRCSRSDPTLSDFNQLIWWMVLLKVGIVFVFLLLTTIFMIWFERRVIGRMQNRPGPNRAGPWGLLQPIADALKLPLKEDIVPTRVDKLVFFVAPIIAAGTSFVAFAIIPWGPVVSIFHHQTPLQVADLPVGGAARAGDELDRRLRHRAGRLGVARAVLDARRAALHRAGDQLRDRDGPVVRRGLPRRRLAVHHRDRQRRSALLVRLAAASRRSSSTW